MNPSVIVARPQALIVARPQAQGDWQDFTYVVPRPAIDGWPEGRYRRKVVAEVNLLEAAIHLCEAGVGAAFVPELAVRERIRLGSLAIVAEPPVAVANPFYVVRRAGVRPGAAAEVVFDLLAALLEGTSFA